MKEMCCFVTERLITMRRYEFINSILWSDKNNISSAGMIEKLVVTFLNRKIISNDHYWSTKYPQKTKGTNYRLKCSNHSILGPHLYETLCVEGGLDFLKICVDI